MILIYSFICYYGTISVHCLLSDHTDLINVHSLFLSYIAITAPTVSVTEEGIATAGHQYMLHCTVTLGEGPSNDPAVTWFNPSGEPLSSEGPITLASQPSSQGSRVTTYIIKFSPLYTSHGGVYTCMATVTSPYETLSEVASDNYQIIIQSMSVSIVFFLLFYAGVFLLVSKLPPRPFEH